MVIFNLLLISTDIYKLYTITSIIRINLSHIFNNYFFNMNKRTFLIVLRNNVLLLISYYSVLA